MGFSQLCFIAVYVQAADNLTCYQCIKSVNEECDMSDLKQCPPEKDRCVTHITKDGKFKFKIKYFAIFFYDNYANIIFLFSLF